MENERYRRHRDLLDQESWQRLQGARVLVVGAGGLGSTVLILLARLGVGTLLIRDPGVLDAPDLNRQTLYHTDDLGRPKVEVARQRLQAINPEVTVEALQERVTPETRLPEADLCMDCLDSFGARAALEEALRSSAERAGTDPPPIIHGGAEGWFGQVSTILPGTGGYAGLFGPSFLERRDEGAAGKPIMPHVVVMVASAQVAEVVHWCRGGPGAMLAGKISVIDGMYHDHQIISIHSPVTDR